MQRMGVSESASWRGIEQGGHSCTRVLSRLGLRVSPQIAEPTALGAAYAIGLAVGFWSDPDGLRRRWRADQEWQPGGDADTRDRRYRDWQRAVGRTFDWVEE